MRTWIRVFVLGAIAAAVTVDAAAQTGSLSGRITDSDTRLPLPGAAVTLHKDPSAAGTSPVGYGTTCGPDGAYFITGIPPGKYSLRVSLIGYRKAAAAVEVKTNEDAVRDASLISDPLGLDEVVVTGAASRTEKNRSEVAVSRLLADEWMETNTYRDIGQLLAAKIPGVRISPTSGNAAGDIVFSVRSGAGLYGNSRPVIFLDGTRIADEQIGEFVGGQYLSSLADLDPQDIEKIEVLKGPASSALYGTSGSNGVILVTTRRGRRARADGSSLKYIFTGGWSTQAVEYDRNMALTHGDANALFRNGPISEHALQLNGASGAVDYTASISHRGVDGILRNSDYGGSSARAGVNAAVSDLLMLRANAWYSFSDAHRPLNDDNLTGMFGNTLIMGPVETGAAGSYFFADSAAVQAVSDLTRSRRFTGSMEAVFTPHPALTLRGLAGYDGLFYRTEQHYPADRIYPAIGVMQGWKGIGDNTLDRMNFDVSASWRWSPAAETEAVTTAGGQGFTSASRGVRLYKSEFPNALITNVGAGARLEQGDELLSEAREAGLFLQQEFSWKETCFLSAGVRKDYASSIGEDAPSIVYPRAGAALRIDRLAELPAFLPFMKVRAAYGESGILPSPADGAGIRWGAVPVGTGTGAGIVLLGNPAIEPERVREFEAGLELRAWDFLGVDFTWYDQMSRNSIVAVMNPPSTGLTATATPRNIGAISGSGFETEISARFFRTRDAQLDARLIWNHSVNEVKDLGGGGPIVESVNAVAVGLPRFAFYAHPVTGAIFDQTGTYVGPAIDSLPRFLGTPLPENSGSFGVTLRLFRDLTLTALADFALGGTVHNRTRVYQALYNNDAEYNELATKLGIATAYGITPVPGVAELEVGSDAYRTAADRFARLDPTVPGATGYFESSDYLRLLELGLRYDFTRTLRSLVTPGFPKQISLTLSARNLFMFTKYGGPDPNIESAGGRSIVRGRDFLTLQNPRVFTATMSIGL